VTGAASGWSRRVGRAGRLAFVLLPIWCALAGAAAAQPGSDPGPELQAPPVPVTVGRDSAFVATGLVRPRQIAGRSGVAVVCYRLEGAAWVPRQTTDAAVADAADIADASRYTAALTLPTVGTWRLRAVFAAGTALETSSIWSDQITVAAAPDAPIWDRDGVSTIPEQMAGRSDARQLVVVTGRSLGSRDGIVRLFDYRDGDWVEAFAVRSRLGARGLVDGLLRRAGTRTTPTGIWRLPAYVFGTHARPPASTRMGYRRITRRSWWSEERNATYNTWVETSRRVHGEHLADYPKSYEFVVSSGYNARPNPRVYGRGSAIFIHVSGYGHTAGCVSVPRSAMVRILRWLDPSKRPACAIGTLSIGSPSSIFAY
jgi:L,D-peptidoglycan transpeptidase YkuD (ErfK/YbiS/YcfS/YnhG family)